MRLGLEQKEVNFDAEAGGRRRGAMGAEEAKKADARVENIKKTFAEGATLTNAGQVRRGDREVQRGPGRVPKCFDCYNNLGTIYSRKKEWDKAEEPSRRRIELSPDNIEAYNGLASVYNAQKKFKEAQAMSAEANKRRPPAARGGQRRPRSTTPRVISWNANDFPKAYELFDAGGEADPKHADSHFMLGRVLINLGKLGEAATEFETYLKLAPTGPNAKEAQTNFEAFKSYRK